MEIQEMVMTPAYENKFVVGNTILYYDDKNSWYLKYGYLEYPGCVEVCLRPQSPILSGLSWSKDNFPVC